MGLRNCLSFEMVAGGIEPLSRRLTVRHSTTLYLLCISDNIHEFTKSVTGKDCILHKGCCGCIYILICNGFAVCLIIQEAVLIFKKILHMIVLNIRQRMDNERLPNRA